MQRLSGNAIAVFAALLVVAALTGCATIFGGGGDEEAPSPADEIAADLEIQLEAVAGDEVDALIEGSIERVGDEVRITARLIQAPAPELDICYLGLEFASETTKLTAIQVHVDGVLAAILVSGDKGVAKFPEGARQVWVTRANSPGKSTKKNSFQIQLSPFVYTKLVITAPDGKPKGRLIVSTFEDGEAVRSRSLEL